MHCVCVCACRSGLWELVDSKRPVLELADLIIGVSDVVTVGL